MEGVWTLIQPWIMPIMIAAVIVGQRKESEKSARILTQQAVQETQLKHIDERLKRLENG